MKKITVIALLLAAALGAQARNGSGKPAYKDASRPVEERVSDLLSRMTLEEKVMQLNQYTLGRNDNANNVADPVDKIPAEIGSLIYFDTSPELRNRLQKKAIEQSRLGIPVLFGYDVIHGFRTTYPISLAQACSWNPALVKQAAEVAAQEARMSGVEWTFSPMIDVARDGRWGRVSEGYGEDPYANAVYGVAAVEGYQGDNLADSRRVAACLKHFVGYGASEAGRDYVYTEISRQTLWDTYMPPYQAGIEAGAATVMSCFNDISGTPGTANPYILTEVLKERWAHDGFVVSDWAAIEQLRSQGVAADRKEAAEKAKIELGEEKAAIVEVQMLMLDDLDYLEGVAAAIEGGAAAADAALDTGEEFAAVFAAMDDEYMNARSADIRDMSHRIYDILCGNTGFQLPDGKFLLIAEDLAPSETIQLPRERILGFVTQQGSSSSHTAILARTLNIPSLVQSDISLEDAESCTILAVDGFTGNWYIDPDDETMAVLKAKQAEAAADRAALEAYRGKESITKSGKKIILAANIGSPEDAEAALAADCEGVGLMRSEFLYLGRDALPSEDELFEAAKVLQVPYDLILYVHNNGRLPVVNFAAGGVATPADAALMMQLGAEGVFVGSGIFKSGNPAKRAAAIVKAVTNYTDAKMIAELSADLGEAMVGINEQEIELLMAERGK